MKSKKSHKFLLPLVSLIWLGVVGQFLGWWETDHGVEIAQAEKSRSHISDTLETKEITLKLDYRDPFLGRTKQNPNPSKKTIKPLKTRLQKVIPKTPIKVPHLRYQGLVQGFESQTAILQINRKTFTVRSGDSVQGIHIESIAQNKLGIRISDSLLYVYP